MPQTAKAYLYWSIFAACFMLLTWPAAYVLSRFADVLHAWDVGPIAVVYLTYGLLVGWYLLPVGLAIWIPARIAFLRRSVLMVILAGAYIAILYVPAQRGVDFVSILRSILSFLPRTY